MHREWNDVVGHYRDMAARAPDFRAFHKLVQHIASSPFSKVLYCWTSTHELCIVPHPFTYPYDGPYLKVSLQDNGEIEFRYINKQKQETQWHKTVKAPFAPAKFEKFIAQLGWSQGKEPDTA